MQDIILVCKECGKKFVFSAEEQEMLAKHGITALPAKCIPCRKAKRDASYAQGITEILQNPQQHEVTCRLCGRVFVTLLKNVLPDAAKFCRLCAPKQFDAIHPKEDIALNQGLGYPKYKA